MTNTTPTVIRFTASWCGPCRNYEPIFRKVTAEYDGISFTTFDVDSEEGRAAAKDLKIIGVPATAILEADEDPVVIPGVLSEDKLRSLFDSVLSRADG